MLSYETLDYVADIYNPTIGFILLVIAALPLIKGQVILFITRLVMVLIALFVAYGFMFADHQLRVFEAIGLDYSAHTAVSISLVLCLVALVRRLWTLWVISFLCYVLLMLYQGYHTLADIMVTSVLVGVPASLLVVYCSVLQRRQLVNVSLNKQHSRLDRPE